MSVIFRPLAENDLELLCQWLNRPHVLNWWGGVPKTLQETRDKYIPRISGEVPSKGFICYEEEGPVGYIQTHWLVDFPDYAEKLGDGVEPNMASMDIFISDEKNLHRGLGQSIMRDFLHEIVFTKMRAEACTVGPSIENKPSIRAYEKAGFSHWKTVDVSSTEREYVMMITREQFLRHHQKLNDHDDAH
jgi:RimJ/RimL family protein N-acetyltransferase